MKKCRAILGVYACILAVWTQLLAPAAAMSMPESAASFTVICSQNTLSSHGKDQGDHKGHNHDCCPLCHAYLGVAPLNGQPAYTAIDYPDSSPLRWMNSLPSRHANVWRRGNRPRGPPTLD